MIDLYSNTTKLNPLRHSEVVEMLAVTPIIDSQMLLRSVAGTISHYFRNESTGVSQEYRKRILNVASALTRTTAHMVDYVSSEDDSVAVPDIYHDLPLMLFGTHYHPVDELMVGWLTRVPELTCYRRDDRLTAYMARIATKDADVQLIPELTRQQNFPVGMAVTYNLTFAAYEVGPDVDTITTL